MPFSAVSSRPRPKLTAPSTQGLLSIRDLPPQVREVATLRGLGHSATRIGRLLGLPRCRVVNLLTLNRRPFNSLHLIKDKTMLSSRAVNSLALCGIHTPDEALARGAEGVMQSLQNLPNCGDSTRDEVRRWIKYYADQAAEYSVTTRAPEAGSDNGSESARSESERAVELQQAHLESELEHHNARRAQPLR